MKVFYMSPQRIRWVSICHHIYEEVSDCDLDWSSVSFSRTGLHAGTESISILRSNILISGKDIIINVTVIKPRPDMTYDDLGLIVWNWPFLCVRRVIKGSIFRHTAVKEGDQIAAINDIDCSDMNEEKFARCASTLPTEISITLIRRKHRYTGSYN
mmetsp:Transcript_37274/g.69019  ORF Transcript_37274/g.69019 Transcript_37274/m.69019 type:complete len:156 (+) Transcript_37274:727-1194(+)